MTMTEKDLNGKVFTFPRAFLPNEKGSYSKKEEAEIDRIVSDTCSARNVQTTQMVSMAITCVVAYARRLFEI